MNAPQKRPATLADVAARAGVAVSTVSRALSRPGRVNTVTRERIERAAAELDYIPHPSARALSGGRTATVAVLVPDITNPFYFDIIRGTQRELKAAGQTQLLIDTEESEAYEEEVLGKLSRSCDGAILTAPRLPDARIQALERTTVPLVTINRPRVGGGSVVIDTPAGVVQGVEHLVSLGHRRLVYVSGPRSSWSNDRRWRAISRSATGLGVEAVRTGPFPPVTASGTAAADAVINSRATGVLAFNDMIAIGMLQRFAARGVSVPADISVVGCDDTFGASFCHPALTTIRAPIEHAGRVAVSILMGQFRAVQPGSRAADPSTRPGSKVADPPTRPGSKVADPPTRPGSKVADRARTALLPTHLVVRDSTGPAPRA